MSYQGSTLENMEYSLHRVEAARPHAMDLAVSLLHGVFQDFMEAASSAVRWRDFCSTSHLAVYSGFIVEHKPHSYVSDVRK